MFQRQISRNEVKAVLTTGQVIEVNSDDKPLPSYLILGWVQNRPLHVKAADNVEALATIIITVYEPDDIQWRSDYKTRRSRR